MIKRMSILASTLFLGLSIGVQSVHAVAGVDTNPISDVTIDATFLVTETNSTYTVEFTLDEDLDPADFEKTGTITTPQITFFATFEGNDNAGSNINFSNAIGNVDDVLSTYVLGMTFQDDSFVLEMNSGDTLPAGTYTITLTGVNSQTINNGFQSHQIGAAIFGFLGTDDYCGNQYDRANDEFLCTMSAPFLLQNDDWADKFGKLVVKKVKKRKATIDWQYSNYWGNADKIKIQLRKRNGKLVKNFTINQNQLYMGKENLTISKKYLKKGRKYKVRAKSYYSTGDKTTWGKYKKFKTKGKK